MDLWYVMFTIVAWRIRDSDLDSDSDLSSVPFVRVWGAWGRGSTRPASIKAWSTFVAKGRSLSVGSWGLANRTRVCGEVGVNVCRPFREILRGVDGESSISVRGRDSKRDRAWCSVGDWGEVEEVTADVRDSEGFGTIVK